MSNLTDILGDQKEKNAKTNRIYGVVSAIVTDNHDPNGKARVKLKFPWLEDQAETDWAKVTSLMAGNDRGVVFLPEKDDEVLVAFEHGDVQHPYVLGALWNSQDTPPETNGDGKNNIRKIKSRSGHVVVLDDTSGAEKIVIQDKSGSNLITIDSVKGEIRIESQTSLKIKSTQIEIESQANMKISAGGILEIKGSMVKIN